MSNLEELPDGVVVFRFFNKSTSGRARTERTGDKCVEQNNTRTTPDAAPEILPLSGGGCVPRRPKEDTSTAADEREESLSSTVEIGKKRKTTAQKVIPQKKAKTLRSPKRSRRLLDKSRTNSKNSEATEPNTAVSRKTSHAESNIEGHHGDKAQKNRKATTADRVMKVKSTRRKLRVQKDQTFTGTNNVRNQQNPSQNSTDSDNVENDLEEMDHNELRNNECYEMQKNRQKYVEDNELAFNATNGRVVNVCETDDQGSGIDDSEKDCSNHGCDNTTNLQEKYTNTDDNESTVRLGEDYNDPDYDDTGISNEEDDDYGIDDTAPSEEDNNDPGDDDTPPRSRLVSCVYCSGVFGSYPQWLGHALEYHPGRVQRDPQRNDGIKRTCPYCPGSFWRADRLLRHIGMRHATDPDVLKRRLHLGLESCGHGCGALIIRRFLPRHQLTCRGEEARAGVGYTSAGGDRGTRGEGGANLTITSYKHRSTRVTVCYPECIARADRKELFECSVCDREFKHHSAVVLHEARHVTTPPGGGGRKESNGGTGDIEENGPGSSRVGVKCSDCDETFSSVYFMKKHAIKHGGGAICPFCAKILYNVSMLNQHIRMRHEERKETFLCQYCGKGFTTKATQRYHLRKFHNDYSKSRSNAEALMCSECGATVNTEAELKRHVAWIHRGQSEYKCEYCDVMFKTARHRDDHVARHLGFKRYQCPVCKTRFTNEGTLYNHMHRFKIHGELRKYHRSELVLPLPEVAPEVQNIRYDIPNRISRKRRGQEPKEEDGEEEREPVEKTDAKSKGKVTKVKKGQKGKAKITKTSSKFEDVEFRLHIENKDLKNVENLVSGSGNEIPDGVGSESMAQTMASVGEGGGVGVTLSSVDVASLLQGDAVTLKDGTRNKTFLIMRRSGVCSIVPERKAAPAVELVTVKRGDDNTTGNADTSNTSHMIQIDVHNDVMDFQNNQQNVL